MAFFASQSEPNSWNVGFVAQRVRGILTRHDPRLGRFIAESRWAQKILICARNSVTTAEALPELFNLGKVTGQAMGVLGAYRNDKF